MSQQTAPPPGPPPARRPDRPPPMRGPAAFAMAAGMPAEKSMHFWPSAKRLLRPAGARSGCSSSLIIVADRRSA